MRGTCGAAPSGWRGRCGGSVFRRSSCSRPLAILSCTGEWLGAPGAPTILLYGHYDVQPVDPLDQWLSPPFEATIRDGELFARGAADDKGQVFMHLKAIEAYVKQKSAPADEHQGDPRGRGGSRRRSHRRLRADPQGPAHGQRRRDLRLADVRARGPVDLLRAPRHRRTSRSTCAARRPTCTPGRSAARWRTRRSCSRR